MGDVLSISDAQNAVVTSIEATEPGRSAADSFSGECLCGAITFEVGAAHPYGINRATGFCTCSNCRRWSGGQGLLFVVAMPERFRVICGEELVAHYRDDTLALRAFCRRCGSSLYLDTGTTYCIGAGTLHESALALGFHSTARPLRPEQTLPHSEGMR
jgi:hypothetical protein